MPAPELIIGSLRGGLNDSETPPELDVDQVVVAQNIDFDKASCGGKRNGTSPVDNGYAGPITAAAFLFRHTPVNDEHLTELWMGGPGAGGAGDLDYRDASGWRTYSQVSYGLDTLIAASGMHALEAQSLHGKLFLAYPAESGGSPVDRLHVREDVSVSVTRFRRTGLREPAAPSTGTAGGSGAYSTVRYARYRYIAQDGSGNILRRSEPSESTSFTPDGTDTGMVVTRGALLGEGETHWEVELSLDDANFYRVATQAVATATYTDSVAAATGYATDGVLSADIGDYALIWSAKFLAADEDRLLYAGSWVDPTKASRVGWTPVAGGVGAGNDERVETDTDPYVDLDGFDGGELTSLDGPVNGFIYAFKRAHIYKLARSGRRSQAYEARCVTKTLGALPRSVVRIFDESGQTCLGFCDPQRGPHRIGANGIEDCGHDIQATWARLNLDATVPCVSEFYPEKRQWWIWIAVDGAMFPNLKLVQHIKHVRRSDEGAGKGWAHHTGKSARALAACLYAENLADVPSDAQSLRLKPYLGLPAAVASGEAILQQADLGVADDGETYQGLLRTKPFAVGNLLQKVGVRAGAIMAEAVSGGSISVGVTRDYDRETVRRTASLTAPSGQSRVVVPLDSLALSDIFALQIEIGDTAVTSGTWAIDQIAMQLRTEESA